MFQAIQSIARKTVSLLNAQRDMQARRSKLRSAQKRRTLLKTRKPVYKNVRGQM